MSTASVRYAFDKDNRLVLTDPRDLLRPTRVIEGRLSADAKNRLLYSVDSPAGPAGSPGPHATTLDGTWALTPTHELALIVHEAGGPRRQTVYLKGTIAGVEAHALGFALRHSEDESLRTSQRITLTGRWQADAHNRLTFLVEKADGTQDRLTFQGGWGVGRRHELFYRYRRRAGRRRDVEERTLIFEGRWDITRADRLVYRLEGSSDSVFEFRASLQSPSLLASDGRIVYQVGVGSSGGRAQQQRLTLFGTWKVHRDLSVSFEIPYADGRVGTMRFEGRYALGPRDQISVALRNSRREGLGLAVVFSRTLLGDARLFLRLGKDERERSIIGGVHVPF
ncbi:MAG: hypothetical protein Q8R91_08865 [Candidatus Omnitrophota bacterium]|nr:hypothetical protein [Candidatus Omnitrophota bacterium]